MSTRLLCPHCADDALYASDQLRNNGFEEDGETQRFVCKECGGRSNSNTAKEGNVKVRMRDHLPKRKKRYLITCAQNSTDVYEPFWRSLLHCARELDAELVVIPIRYKNPTTQKEDYLGDEWWDPIVRPYLFDGRQAIHKHLTILGDVKTQLTAIRPTTGYESMTGGRSCILGHPKLELRSIATPQQKLPKIVTTTGACTERNYSDTRAGKRGDFHHTYGAALVELQGDKFYLRQINATEAGEFIDLKRHYTPKGSKKAGRWEALILGDAHVDYIDPKVVKATFTNKDSMVNYLKPKRLMWHDLLDGYAVNPHTEKDPFHKIAKRKVGADDIREEVTRASEFVRKHAPKDVENVVVPSNHDDFLNRWMERVDWREDPTNAEFFLETALAMVRGSYMAENGFEKMDPFVYWMEQLCPDLDITYPGLNGSYTVMGIECGMHGHLGLNGARGSLLSFSKLGVKTVTGHSHIIGIYEGAYCGGTMSYLRLDYNPGPSSWLQANVGINALGKRCIFIVVDGSWKR